jgi:hypothetical protein
MSIFIDLERGVQGFKLHGHCDQLVEKFNLVCTASVGIVTAHALYQ